MPKPETVRCPKCNRPQRDTGADSIYWCSHCRMQFDTTDDGGTYSDHNPAARLEREERNQQRKAKHANRRT